MTDRGEFDDLEPTERLFKRIEDYKRVTSQLFKDHGIASNERAHFRNYASYILRQGSINEQDTFIRGLNTPMFVHDRTISRNRPVQYRHGEQDFEKPSLSTTVLS